MKGASTVWGGGGATPERVNATYSTYLSAGLRYTTPYTRPSCQLDDALGFLPCIGNCWVKRKASFIKIIERDLALVLLFLQGDQFSLTAGKGLRIAETLSRLAHPFPSKTCLFGQPFERRETEALLGFVGEAFPHPFERTRLFFDIVLDECLFCRLSGKFH